MYKTMSKTRALAVVGMVALLFASGARITAEPSATPRLDWFFDQFLTATARIGNVIYVGGGFSRVLPTSGVLGYFVALSTTTGVADPNFAPANSPIHAVEPDGSGGYFISQRATAGPTALLGDVVVHVRPDGSVDPAFSSAAIAGLFGRLVRVGPSLVVAGTSYISGTGIDVGGVARPLVALDAASGALSPWVPVLPGPSPKVVDVEAANGRLFVLSQPAVTSDGRHVSAFDGVTGALLWTVQVVAETTQYPIFSGGALAVSGTRLIVGTDPAMRALDVATGGVDPAWGGSLTGVKVYDVALSSTTVFVSGTFTTFMGAARSNLAALDLTNGALTSWTPPASIQAGDVAVSSSGSLFVPLLRTGAAGALSQAIVELDAAGAPTAWTSATYGSVFGTSPAGALLVGTSSLAAGGTPRMGGLAAFDATTGALLPEAPALTGPVVGGTQRAYVSGLVAVGQTLYISGSFTAVNGTAREFGAAVDTTTNALLPWTLPAAEQVVLAHGGYVYTADPIGGWRVRRRDATTGAADPAWQPPLLFDLVPDGSSLIALAAPPAPAFGMAVGSLDPMSGLFVEAFRTSALLARPSVGRSLPFGGRLALDGDTAYLAGALPDPLLQLNQRDLADTVVAFDRKTGIQVGPSLRGYINGVTVADGRVIPFGGRLVTNGQERVEVAEIAGPAGFTPWSVAWPWRGAPLFFGYLGEADFARGVGNVSVAGDLLVVRGASTGLPGAERLAAYPLSGNSVPSRLRAQVVGPNTVFSWDPMAFPPAGGYVIEGGFAAGQTAGALPVGNATSVALPMPPGPAFIRVRPQGSTDVSNEIVAGCFAPPLPPTALTTTLNGINLTLAWTAPAGAVTGYSLLAGTASGLSNAATLALGPQTSVAGPVPGGTFFARVTASNACGTSAPSGEVFFTIGAPDALPAAPTNLAASVNGNTVSLSWTAPAGPVTGYVIEAGTGAGLANLGSLQIGTSSSIVLPGVPAGTYSVRLRAITSAGSGAPSADVVVVVVVP